MEISPGLELRNLCLYFEEADILAISDFHIGFEEALNKQGVLVPRLQWQETKKMLAACLPKHVSKIVILGDIKHEFGTISRTEWLQTLELIDLLAAKCDELILLKGNHDTILAPIAAKRNIKIKDFYFFDGNLLLHGHKIPRIPEMKKAYRFIIGHEHPAISISSDSRSELFKCFLKGKFKGKELIVMPSFNLVSDGTNILKEQLLSPFLKQDLSDFDVFIVGNKSEVYGFGKVKNIRH